MPVLRRRFFIREALVSDEVALPYPFVAQNRELRARVETWQMQQRLMQFLDLDEAAYRFYAERLENVSSTHDLNRLIKRKGADFLLMSEKHLAGEQVDFDRDAFPNFLEVDGEEVPLSYAYRPGQDRDGVTLQLPYKLVHFVQPEVLDWLVPGLLEEKITHLLRGASKAYSQAVCARAGQGARDCRGVTADAWRAFGFAVCTYFESLWY